MFKAADSINHQKIKGSAMSFGTKVDYGNNKLKLKTKSVIIACTFTSTVQLIFYAEPIAEEFG